jgi:uncharacterized protein YndB with AHSA1/START domain
MANQSDPRSPRHEVVITRIFDAPRDVVFTVWTDPRYVVQWWGLNGCTIPTCSLELKSGARWRIEMVTKQGVTYPNSGEVLEVIQNERFAYSSEFDAKDPIWAGSLPPNAVNSITFEDFEGTNRTKVTVTISFGSAEGKAEFLRRGTEHGIQEGLSRLAQLLLELMEQTRRQRFEKSDLK